MLALAACMCAVLVVPSLGGGAQEAVVPEEATVSPLSDSPSAILTEVDDNVTVAGVTVNETIKVPYPDMKQESGHQDNKIYGTKFAPPKSKSPTPAPGKPTPAPTIIYGDSRDQKVTKKGRLISGPGHRRRTGDGFGHLYSHPPPKALTPKEIDHIEGKHKLLKDAWGHQKLKSYTSAQVKAMKEKKKMKAINEESKAFAKEVMKDLSPKKKQTGGTGTTPPPYKKGVHVFTKDERKAEAKAAKFEETQKAVKKAEKGHDMLKDAFEKKTTKKAEDPLMTANLPKSAAEDMADQALKKATAASNDDFVKKPKKVVPKHCGGCVAMKTFCEEVSQQCHPCPPKSGSCAQSFMHDTQTRDACEAAVKASKCAVAKATAAPTASPTATPTATPTGAPTFLKVVLQTKYSKCATARGEEIQFLDRQHMVCPGTNPITSFQFGGWGCSGKNMKYKFTCTGGKGTIVGAEKMTQRKAGCSTNTGHQLQFLDRQSVKCHKDEAIKQISGPTAQGCSGKNKQYIFYCTKMTGAKNQPVSTHTTSCQPVVGKPIEYLDRLKVSCPTSTALQSFHLARGPCPNGKMRYTFGCIKIPGTA
jgi:hypothetical protein